jgi:arylsulfatase A-like enzyme
MKAIVIVVHGWNVGWLGPYGNEWVLTPNLDRLAVEGVVFDRHIADLPDPALAWQTLWSGRYSFRAQSDAAKRQPRQVPLAALPHGDIQTIWLPDLGSTPHPEQEEYWETVITPRRDADGGPEVALIAAVEAGLEMLAGAISSLLWIETDRPLPPWSINDDVFAAYFDACGPLLEEDEDAPASDGKPIVDELPPPWADPPSGKVQRLSERDWRRLAASFASVTSQLDTELGEIFERLREAGLECDCLWLVTATAGLPLGEHRHIGYRHPSLYEEQTHVPLMLRLPGGREAGRRVNALTQPVDVLPTLLEWFQLPLPSGVHGKSLLPLATRHGEQIRQYAVTGLQVGEATEWALQTPQWKLILPAQPPAEDAPLAPQLFEKPDDRWEVNDLRAKHLEWAEHLEQRLRGFVEAAAADGPLVPPVLQAHDEFLKTLSPAGEPGKDNV